MITRFVSPGDMRTDITVCKAVKERDADGYTTETLQTVTKAKCKWQTVHGNESFSADQIGYTQPATISMRYKSGIDEDCIIYKSGEALPYRIISVDDVEGRHRWLEIKVTKKARSGE